jgi:hypothetical protein
MKSHYKKFLLIYPVETKKPVYSEQKSWSQVWLRQGMSDSCLTPTQQFFSYIMARTSLLSMR